MSRRLRVAWFSPLDGGSVARYVTDILLPRIAESVDLTLFHNGERRSVSAGSKTIQAEHYLNAVRIDQDQPFDIFFYQLEDRKECDFMRIHLALRPGIVWFHDLLLSNHGPEPILNSSWTETVERFIDPARAWPDHAREYTTAGVFAEREAAMNFLALFSNPRDHEEYTRLTTRTLTVGDNRSMLLRHPVPVDLFLKENAPRSHDEITIALCGLPRVESQIHQFFEALHRSPCKGTVLWPVPEKEVSRAEALVAEFDLNDRCTVYADEGAAGWARALDKAHLGIHLRFSAFGQPSPYLPMTLAAGIPAIVTDFASGALYPENAVFKVSPGRDQVVEIAAILDVLAASAKSLASGRHYATEFFHPDLISQQLLQVFENEAPRVAQYAQRWRAIEWDAHRELVREARELMTNDGNFIDESVEQLFDPIFAELGWLKAEVV